MLVLWVFNRQILPLLCDELLIKFNVNHSVRNVTY